MEQPAPHFLQPLLKTPFHERARRFSQVDRFIPWAGYTTVDVFTSVEQEYFAIRNAATLYDLTPMVKYRVAGPDAGAYLNRLVTRNIGKLNNNRVSYCVWCNDAGHIIDDVGLSTPHTQTRTGRTENLRIPVRSVPCASRQPTTGLTPVRG